MTGEWAALLGAVLMVAVAVSGISVIMEVRHLTRESLAMLYADDDGADIAVVRAHFAGLHEDVPDNECAVCDAYMRRYRDDVRESLEVAHD